MSLALLWRLSHLSAAEMIAGHLRRRRVCLGRRQLHGRWHWRWDVVKCRPISLTKQVSDDLQICLAVTGLVGVRRRTARTDLGTYFDELMILKDVELTTSRSTASKGRRRMELWHTDLVTSRLIKRSVHALSSCTTPQPLPIQFNILRFNTNVNVDLYWHNAETLIADLDFWNYPKLVGCFQLVAFETE